MASRTARGYQPGMGNSTQQEAPSSGQTVNVIQTNSGNIYVLIQPPALLAALSLQLPTQGAFDGQSITFAFTQPITLLNLLGPVIGAITGVLAGGFSKYVWSTTNMSWNRCG